MNRPILVAVAILLFNPSLSFGETVSLSTYYPAPFGTYDRLRLVPRADIPNPCRVGTFYTREQPANTYRLRFCRDTGSGVDSGAWAPMDGLWENDGADNVYLDDWAGTDPNFRVGIRDQGPDAVLEVSANGGGDDLLMLSDNDNDDGDLFIVKNNGRVGVGDVNPDARLEVSANGGGDDLLMLSDNDGGDGDVFIVRSNGNVGINENNPSAKLHVRTGSGGANQEVARFQSNAPSAYIRIRDGGQSVYITADDDINTVGIGPSSGLGNSSIKIRNNGDVIMGANPSIAAQKLNIDGGLNLRDDGNNWGRLMVEYNSGRYYAVYAP